MTTTNNTFSLNEATIRTIALQVCILSVISCFVAGPWICLFLSIDFGLRAFTPKAKSPLKFIANHIKSYLFSAEKFVFAPPKIFAAKIGFGLNLLASIAYFQGYHFLGIAISVGVIIFSFLEGALGICVACYVYDFYFKLINHNQK